MKTDEALSGRLVLAIEAAWSAIQKNHTDVPDVVVTLGSGSGNSTGLTLGHFAASRWVRGDKDMHELFVSGEGLNRKPAEVMGTLLHEAAHGAAQARGVQDTSRQGRYHNKKFKSIAESFGLIIEQAQGIGWSATTVPAATAAKYARAIEQLEAAMAAWRRSEGRGAETGRKSNNGYAAACDCGRKIRLSVSVYEEGEIICSLCESPFVAEEE